MLAQLLVSGGPGLTKITYNRQFVCMCSTLFSMFWPSARRFLLVLITFVVGVLVVGYAEGSCAFGGLFVFGAVG